MANESAPVRDQHVIILGGGISGLSAAWRLADKGVKVTVLESGSHEFSFGAPP